MVGKRISSKRKSHHIAHITILSFINYESIDHEPRNQIIMNLSTQVLNLYYALVVSGGRPRPGVDGHVSEVQHSGEPWRG
eukprot:1975323-Rhodomonas_salina.3